MFFFHHTTTTPTSVEQLDAACAAEGRYPAADEAIAAVREDARHEEYVRCLDDIRRALAW